MATEVEQAMSNVDVSDHALVRYLERAKGVDVNAARAELAAKATRLHRVDQLFVWAKGAVIKVNSAERETIVMRNGRVITYIVKGARK